MHHTHRGWLRLWIVLSALAVLSAGIVIYVNWPQKNWKIVRDIASPACKPWLSLPKGFIPDNVPVANEPCENLLSFMHAEQINIASEVDYEEYLASKINNVMPTVLFTLLFTIVGLYIIGWTIEWLVNGFRTSR